MTRRCVVINCRRHVRGPTWAVCDTCFARLAKAEQMPGNGRG